MVLYSGQGGALYRTPWCLNCGIFISSKDAKKVYVHTTAAALRAKESIMTTVTTVRENAEDILAMAKDINDARAKKESEELIEDKN